MTGHGSSGQGTGGSSYDGSSERYDGVPYSNLDFHQPYCEINDYGNVDEVRNCYLVTLNDLDGGKDYVRGKIADYFNDMISMGVSGFRIDASKHMWPGDLEAIQGLTNDVAGGGKALFMHEVIDMGGEPISSQEYFGVGKVTEFRYGIKLAECIRGGDWNCLGGIYDQVGFFGSLFMHSLTKDSYIPRDGAWLMVCMHLCLLTTTTTSVDMVVVVESWLHKTMLGLIR